MDENSRNTDSSGASDGWPDSSSSQGGWPTPAPVPAGGAGAGGGDGWPTSSASGQGESETHGTGSPGNQGASAPEPSQDAPGGAAGPPTNRLVWIAAAVIVIGLPISVGVVAFRQPASGGEASVVATAPDAEAPIEVAVAADAPDPTWTRPSWADAVEGMVAYELSAGDEVRLANGWVRPTLGISCADGRTDIHVATGGSAPIDPVTSGHMVKLTFDGRTEQTLEQQWSASEDQRNLLAPDPLPLALRLASAGRLELTFTHYMTGAEVLEFDLRGADEVITSMAAPCGWATQ